MHGKASFAGLVAVGLMLFCPGGALATSASRTIGPMTTVSGKTCSITVGLSSTDRNTVALSNVTYGDSIQCTAGLYGLQLGGTSLADRLKADDVQGLEVAANASWCNTADSCSQSSTYSTGVPTTRYGLVTGDFRLEAQQNWGTNDPTKNDWWSSWPADCHPSIRRPGGDDFRPDTLTCAPVELQVAAF
jgi:hypothetical protein